MSYEVYRLKEQVRRLEHDADAQTERLRNLELSIQEKVDTLIAAIAVTLPQAQANLHREITARLSAIESRLSDVESRLAHVEDMLGEDGDDDIVLSDHLTAWDPATVNGRIAMVRRHLKDDI